MDLGVRGLISPQNARFFEKRIKKIIGRGEATFESDHLCEDGSVMPVEVHARTIKSAGKDLILTVIRDITERKQAEQELRLKGEMITNMAEGALVVRTSDNMIVHANPRLEEIFGYGPGELIGKNVSILNDSTSGKSSEEIRLEITNVLNKCGRRSGEIQNVKKNGTGFGCRNSISTLESS